MCVNAQYTLFSFLIYFIMYVSRSTHISANGTISFLFVAE